MNFEEVYATVQTDWAGAGREGAFDATCRAARLLGFPYVIHAPVRRHPDAARNWSATTYPQEWQALYVGKNHLPRNPVRKHVLQTLRPFTWSELEATLPVRDRELFHDCRSTGMRNGFVVPVHGPRGQAVAVGFACEHEDALAPRALPLLQLLALRLHHTWDEVSDPLAPRLTPRERELMQHVAEGHDNATLADLLNLSDNSIEWHLKNVFRKLEVRSRTAAVVKSIQLGLIHI